MLPSQAVLACDVERTNLLQEEQQILAKMASKVCTLFLRGCGWNDLKRSAHAWTEHLQHVL
jgi:hypothetical protein